MVIKMRKRTIFTGVMGSSPTIKVLQYMLEWCQYDLTISDIARGAAISRNSTYNVISSLIKKKMIITTRIMGKSQLYALNKESPIVKKLSELFKTVVKSEVLTGA